MSSNIVPGGQPVIASPQFLLYIAWVMKEKVLEFLQKVRKSKLIIFPAAVVVAIVLYSLKGLVVAATVNGSLLAEFR